MMQGFQWVCVNLKKGKVFYNQYGLCYLERGFSFKIVCINGLLSCKKAWKFLALHLSIPKTVLTKVLKKN